LVGVLLILFYWLVYDTTVPDAPGMTEKEWAQNPLVGRVYNLGLQQNRLIGTVVGLGFFAGGIALRFLDKKKD
jgi:hypothetical protein